MKRTASLLLVGVTAVALAACGSSSNSNSNSSTNASTAQTTAAAKAPASAPATAGTVDVSYKDIAIHPTKITVKVGEVVHWTNNDAVPHNVVSESGPGHFSSAILQQGQTFDFKATTPGVIKYMCSLHPTQMQGQIDVVK